MGLNILAVVIAACSRYNGGSRQGNKLRRSSSENSHSHSHSHLSSLNHCELIRGLELESGMGAHVSNLHFKKKKSGR